MDYNKKTPIAMLPSEISMGMYFWGFVVMMGFYVCLNIYGIYDALTGATAYYEYEEYEAESSSSAWELGAEIVFAVAVVYNFLLLKVFAKGCEPLQKNLTSFIMQFGYASLVFEGISLLTTVEHFSESTESVLLWLSGGYMAYVYIQLVNTICKNFDGELGELGQNMWKFPLLMAGIVLTFVFLNYAMEEYNPKNYLLLAGLSFIGVLIGCYKFIWQKYNLKVYASGCVVGAIILRFFVKGALKNASVDGSLLFLYIFLLLLTLLVLYLIIKEVVYRIYLLLEEGWKNGLTQDMLKNELIEFGYYNNDNPIPNLSPVSALSSPTSTPVAEEKITNTPPAATAPVEPAKPVENKPAPVNYENTLFNPQTFVPTPTPSVMAPSSNYAPTEVASSTEDYSEMTGNEKKNSKKIGQIILIIIALIIIGGVATFFIYRHHKQKEIETNQMIFDALSEEYFPGDMFNIDNPLITQGKFDGVNEDVVALFPVEESETYEDGEKLYEKLVVRSQSGNLPNLEFTPALFGLGGGGGFSYDEYSPFYLATFDAIFEEGEKAQTGLVIGMDWEEASDAIFYLKNGEWIRGEPIAKFVSSNDESVSSSSISNSTRSVMGFRKGKNSFNAEMISAKGTHFPFDFSLYYDPDKSSPVYNAVYYNPAAKARVDLRVETFSNDFIRLVGKSGGKDFYIQFSGNNPYSGDAWWGEMHTEVKMSLQ